MTGNELVRLTLRHLGEEDDASMVAEYQERILTGLNQAQEEACLLWYRPVTEVPFGVTEGRIKKSDLPAGWVQVAKVTDDKGQRIPYRETGDAIVVHRGRKQVRVGVVLPPPALSMETQPLLPPGLHSALADYAAFRMLLMGGRTRQARGEVFYQLYQKKMQELRPMEDHRRFQNLW